MIDLIGGEVAIESEYDIVAARKAVRKAAVDIGFNVTDVTRIVTAASELSRNIYLYAQTGSVSWRALDGDPGGIEIAFVDHGPGIEDLEQAMTPGYSSDKGMGMGLPGAKRLTDEMEIRTSPGDGCTVIIRKWLRR